MSINNQVYVNNCVISNDDNKISTSDDNQDALVRRTKNISYDTSSKKQSIIPLTTANIFTSTSIFLLGSCLANNSTAANSTNSSTASSATSIMTTDAIYKNINENTTDNIFYPNIISSNYSTGTVTVIVLVVIAVIIYLFLCAYALASKYKNIKEPQTLEMQTTKPSREAEVFINMDNDD